LPVSDEEIEDELRTLRKDAKAFDKRMKKMLSLLGLFSLATTLALLFLALLDTSSQSMNTSFNQRIAVLAP